MSFPRIKATVASAVAGIAGPAGAQDEFVQDFVTDIMPYVATHYRIQADRQHRAIAGLSMGGTQTLNIAIPHLDKFAYVGVFSSGLIGGLLGAGSRTRKPGNNNIKPNWTTPRSRQA